MAIDTREWLGYARASSLSTPQWTTCTLDRFDEEIMEPFLDATPPHWQEGSPSTAASPPSDGQVVVDLAALDRHTALTQLHFTSHRKVLGRVVILIKQGLRRLLTPILERQTAYNTTNTHLVSYLCAQVDLLRQQYLLVQEEVNTLRQQQLEAVPQRVQMQSLTSPDVEGLPKGWLTPEEDALVPPRHLWLGPGDPISHYYRWVWEYLAYLTLLCDLRRESSVLELGCGHGRTARGLLGYLRPPGRYIGLDVDRIRIEDAQARIQSRHPPFQFIWADVYNAHYHPWGSTPAASYRFPFPDAEFDVIYAASLFTHLLPDETRNYFHESRRVLKAGGKCLFSMFLLDHYRGQGATISPLYEFNHPFPGHAGVAVRDLAHPDALIGYSIEQIRSVAEDAGLRLLRVIPGAWSESPGLAVNEQDLILMCRDQ